MPVADFQPDKTIQTKKIKVLVMFLYFFYEEKKK